MAWALLPRLALWAPCAAWYGLCAFALWHLPALRNWQALLGAAAAPVLARDLFARGRLLAGGRAGRDLAPALWTELDRIAAGLGGRGPDEVVLTHGLDAELADEPAVLPPWGRRRVLRLGLPLLEGLDPAQGRALLTQLLAFLAPRSGRAAFWVEEAWRLADSQDGEFWDWLKPRLRARAEDILTRRAAACDRAAAESCGGQAWIGALSLLLLRARRLERDGFRFLREAAFSAEPPDGVSEALAQLVRTAGRDDPGDLRALLRESRREGDFYGSFADRVKAAGVAPDAALPAAAPATSAAQAWLGESLPALRAQADAAWKESVAPGWAAERDAALRSRARLARLLAERPAGGWPEREELELARLLIADERLDAALPLLEKAVAARPDDMDALALLAGLLSRREDPRGDALLRRIVEARVYASLDAAEFLLRRLEHSGQAEEAARLRAQAAAFRAEWEQAASERARFGHDDVFLPHQAIPGGIEALAECLGPTLVRRAWLVVRPEKRLAHITHHVLMLDVDDTFRGWDDALERVEDERVCRGSLSIVMPSQLPRAARERLRAAPGALVYESASRPGPAAFLRAWPRLPAYARAAGAGGLVLLAVCYGIAGYRAGMLSALLVSLGLIAQPWSWRGR